jgi:ABC-type transport system substrate-binding protein
MGENELGLRYWTARRLTRRRVLAGAATGGAALAAIGLVGCGGGDDNGGGNGGDGPQGIGGNTIQDGYQDGPARPGGFLRTRQANPIPSFNPFGPGIFSLAQQLFLGFTVFDHPWYVPTDTGQVELFLATQLEQPDPLTLTFQIGDATFHDKPPVNGRKVVAADIAASYLRFRDEAPIGYSWLHDIMENVVAVDDRTVRITQETPWAWIYTSSNAGSPISSSIIPPELHQDSDFLTRDAIGSGHWILEGHDNGSNPRLRKFPNFRTFQNGRDITGQPYLDGIDFKLITDENAALAAFRAGDIDTTGFSSKQHADDTARELGDRIIVTSDLSRDYVTLMVTYQEPFLDERVRKAINLSLDRDEAIQLLHDGNAVKAPPVPPAHKAYTLPESDPVYQEYFRSDPAEARELLEAAGWDFDRTVTIRHSNRPVDSNLAQVLQGQLTRSGMKINLEQQDLVRWFSQTLNQGDFEMTCFQHLAYEDPDLPLRFYIGRGEITNFMKYVDDDVNNALIAAASELNEEERIEKVYEAQRTVMRKYSPMFNMHSQVNFGGRYAYIKGGITGRGSYGLFNRTAWLDK